MSAERHPRWAWRSLRSPVTGYALLAEVLGVGVYLPILGNYFHTEDFDVLHIITTRGFFDWVFTPSAGHLLLGRNVLFALTYAVAGGNPAPYFWSVLLTHAVNVAFLFAAIWTATRSARLACAGTTAWAVTPVNEGTLGWYSYAGHAVATMTLLTVVWRLLSRARQPAPVPLREAALWVVLLFIGAQTLGHGLAPALALPVVAVLLLGWGRLSWGVRAMLVGLPAGLLLVYALVSAQTGVRLVSTPYDAGSMLVHLLTVGVTTLVAGFAYPLAAYPSPGAYAVALGAGAVLLLGFALGSPAARRTMLAVGLIAFAMYAAIAFGRATLYRKFMSTMPVYGASQSRYHYAAPAMLAIGVGVALAQIGARMRLRAPWSDVLLWTWLGGAALFYLRSGWTIDHFDAERRDAEAAIEGIHAAVARTPADQLVILLNQPIPSAGRAPYFAGWASIYSIYFRERPDRPVYFIDRDAAWWYGKLGDTHLTRVLVPPPEGGLAEIACPVHLPLACMAASIE